MITPDEIRRKVARLYLPFLRAWLQEEVFFPLDFPVGKLPTDYVELRKAVRDLQGQSREQRGFGYTLDYQVQQKRFSGQQTLPVRIIIETEQDALRLLEKEAEFGFFQQDVARIRKQLPQLETWIRQYPQRVIEQHEQWIELLAVCQYFQEHPRPQMYIRELPIPVHTKFIEQHRGVIRELLEYILPAEMILEEADSFEQRFGLRKKEPLVRLRFLDKQLERLYQLPVTEIGAPLSQLQAFSFLQGQRCIITENEMTFLTLPPQAHTFALLGSGFMVQNLGTLSWLVDCPIFYWGDLDAQGFQILSSLRSLFPHVASLMMDQHTLSAFSAFCVESTPCSIRQLPYLTEDEHTLFLYLAEHNIRLEQERISHTYVLEALAQLPNNI